MCDVVLSDKATKLMTLCAVAKLNDYTAVLETCARDECPAICMNPECANTAMLSSAEDQKPCEACGGDDLASLRYLVGIDRQIAKEMLLHSAGIG